MRMMKSAMVSIWASPIPSLVISMVPMRKPPGRSQSSGRSAGMRFLLVMMLARAHCCAKLPHIGDHLVRGRVALVRAQHGNATPVESRAERLRVAHDLSHVDPPEGEQLGSGGGQGCHAIDLMSGCQHWEDGMGEGFGQRRIVPDDDAALRAAEGLARRPCH